MELHTPQVAYGIRQYFHLDPEFLGRFGGVPFGGAIRDLIHKDRPNDLDVRMPNRDSINQAMKAITSYGYYVEVPVPTHEHYFQELVNRHGEAHARQTMATYFGNDRIPSGLSIYSHSRLQGKEGETIDLVLEGVNSPDLSCNQLIFNPFSHYSSISLEGTIEDTQQWWMEFMDKQFRILKPIDKVKYIYKIARLLNLGWRDISGVELVREDIRKEIRSSLQLA